ncbi:MAG: NAD-dependent epimerase/dehydratase family protein [Patescibacteria group bacterium]
MRGARVLVTGAGGFIGANLARYLVSRGAQVSVLLRDTHRAWRLQDSIRDFDVRVGDLENYEELEKNIRDIAPEYVFHAAMYGGYPAQQDMARMMRVNVLGSEKLFSLLENLGSVKKVINFGSSSEYGKKQMPMREDDLCQPETPYAISKLAQTYIGRSYALKGLPLVTLRLFSVFGPYEEPKRLITDTMTALVRHTTLNASSPEPKRDFIHIDDVTRAAILFATSDLKSGEIINIGSGEEHSIGEVVDTSMRVSGVSIPCAWGSVAGRSFDTNRWVADIGCAREHGWRPAVSFDDGLLKTYEWFRDSIDLYAKREA